MKKLNTIMAAFLAAMITVTPFGPSFALDKSTINADVYTDASMEQLKDKTDKDYFDIALEGVFNGDESAKAYVKDGEYFVEFYENGEPSDGEYKIKLSGEYIEQVIRDGVHIMHDDKEVEIKTTDKEITFDKVNGFSILINAPPAEEQDKEEPAETVQPETDESKTDETEIDKQTDKQTEVAPEAEKHEDKQSVQEDKQDAQEDKQDVQKDKTATTKKSGELKAPSPAIGDAETYNIIINYIFGDNTIAHEPYRAIVNAGDNFHDIVTLPQLNGYEPYYNDEPASTVTLDYQNVQQNKTVTVTYRPVQVQYQVRHYWQNADNDKYTLHETETFMGYTGDIVDHVEKAYPGFAVLGYETPAIAADGSTIVEVYYDREYSLIKFNLNGGYGVEPIYQKWGSTINVPNPRKNGYTFNSWDKPIPATMPYGGDTFTASWDPIGSPYTVVYWKENADDDGYSYWGSVERTAPTGAEVSASDSIPNSISGGDDVHFIFNSDISDSGVVIKGDGTSVVNVYYDRKLYTITLKKDGNDYVCGYENHQHTYDDSHMVYYGGCYPEYGGTETICGQTSHTHTYSCYPNTSNRTASTNNTRTLNNNYNNGDGSIGEISSWFSSTKYVLVNGRWYRYTGSAEAGTKITPTCGQHVHYYEHSAMEYFGGCYPENGGTQPTCGYEEHTHTTACRGTLIHRITAKYGADISNEWTFHGEDGVDYPKTNPVTSWRPVQSTIYNQRLTKIQLMPGENSIFELVTSSNSTKYYDYYVESLSGDQEGTHRTYNGMDYILHFQLTHDFNYYTMAEDFFDFEGFTKQYARTANGGNLSDGASLAANAHYYFYYLRNRYSITYQSVGDHLTQDANGVSLNSDTYMKVPYQKELTDYNITPPYPESFPIGAYTFAGWYDNADFAGEPFDFSQTMPSSPLLLFAKWEPVRCTVNIYQDVDKWQSHDAPLETRQAFYGELMDAPEEPTPEHEEYVFIGWFRMVDGVEKPFTFGDMPVTGDMDIYAKWSSNTIRPYNVYFQTADGEDLSEPIHSSGYAGSTKTFVARDEIPRGYFPRVKSHSILIDIDGNNTNGLNDFTFIYDRADKVPYTVHYVDARTGEKLLPDKVVPENDKVSVTEKFKVISGYVPDAFQKTLVVSLGQPNEITFKYTKDNEHAFYLTRHCTEGDNGGWNLYNAHEVFGNIGDHVTATPMNIDGYHLDTSIPGTVTNGTVTADGLDMVLYYVKNEYPYEVRYIEKNTAEVLHAPKQGMGKFESKVTEQALDIAGYDCVNPEVTITIQQEEGSTAARNIITFRYQVRQARFNYIPVGGGTVSLPSENVAMNGLPVGSTATANDGYEFVGWFTDPLCTQPAPSNLVSGNTITPQKVGDVYVSTTYYAKFRPTSITVPVEKKSLDTGESLTATYKLYKIGEGTPKEFNGSSVNATEVETFTTDGEIDLVLGSEYLLEETVAPDQHNLWDGLVKVSVDTNGNITLTSEMDDKFAKYEDGKLKLYDERVEVIPSGFEEKGAPLAMLTIFGILLMVIARRKSKSSE